MKIVTGKEYDKLLMAMLNEVKQMEYDETMPLCNYTGGSRYFFLFKNRFDIKQGIALYEKLAAMKNEFRPEGHTEDYQKKEADRATQKAEYLKNN